jgi:hypothetical protein
MVKVCYGGGVRFVGKHDKANKAVPGHRVVNYFYVGGVPNHDGGKNSRKNGTTHEGHEGKPVRQDLVYGYYAVFGHYAILMYSMMNLAEKCKMPPDVPPLRSYAPGRQLPCSHIKGNEVTSVVLTNLCNYNIIT